MTGENQDRTFGDNEVTNQSGDNQPDQGQGPSFDAGSPSSSTSQQETPPQRGGDEELRQQIQVLEKRLRDKDEFIETLKSERKEDSSTIDNLKSQVEELEQKSKSVEEVLNRMDASKGGQDDDGNRLTPEEARKVAENVYSEYKSKEEREANFNSVKQELLSVYGNEQVDNKVAETAQNLGMSFDEAFDMAETRPAAFRRLFIGEGQAPSKEPSPPGGSVNTQALTDNPDSNKRQTPFVSIRNEKDRIAALQERMNSKST